MLFMLFIIFLKIEYWTQKILIKFNKRKFMKFSKIKNLTKDFDSKKTWTTKFTYQLRYMQQFGMLFSPQSRYQLWSPQALTCTVAQGGAKFRKRWSSQSHLREAGRRLLFHLISKLRRLCGPQLMLMVAVIFAESIQKKSMQAGKSLYKRNLFMLCRKLMKYCNL